MHSHATYTTQNERAFRRAGFSAMSKGFFHYLHRCGAGASAGWIVRVLETVQCSVGAMQKGI